MKGELGKTYSRHKALLPSDSRYSIIYFLSILWMENLSLDAKAICIKVLHLKARKDIGGSNSTRLNSDIYTEEN